MSLDFRARAELRDLVLRLLEADYVATSCKDAIETGNNYQSVTLGETVTRGFRTRRTEILDRLDFAGKKVLDLGSNVGEISRAVRDRGAYLVDGFEFDELFLMIAQLVNAYNLTTRVSFFRRDITDPAVYSERYDMVVAFSVFTYIGRLIPSIGQCTEVLLVETHNLSNNLDSHYIEPVARVFPHYLNLGESDWGRSLNAISGRAVLLFAKSERALQASVKRGAPLGPSAPDRPRC